MAACGSTILNLPLGTGVMNITSLQPCSAAAPIAAGTPVGMTMTLTLGTSIPGGNFAIIFKCVRARTRAAQGAAEASVVNPRCAHARNTLSTTPKPRPDRVKDQDAKGLYCANATFKI